MLVDSHGETSAAGGRVCLRSLLIAARDRDLDRALPEHGVRVVGYQRAASLRGTIDAFDIAQCLAPSDAPVVLVGEKGVGKAWLAERIHAASKRADERLRVVECGELRVTGVHALADDAGTVVLCALDQLDREVASELATVVRRARARFIATAAIGLQETGRRSRLVGVLSALGAVQVTILPLRQDRERVEALVLEFAEAVAEEMALRRAPRVDDAAMAMFVAHAWPGNVDELKRAVRCAVARAGSRVLTVEDIELRVVAPDASREPAEKRAIIEALAACEGNQTRAAQRLGISRRTLVSRLTKYGLPRPRRRSGAHP